MVTYNDIKPYFVARKPNDDYNHWLSHSASVLCIHAVGEKNKFGCYKCDNRPGCCYGYWWFCGQYEPNLEGQLRLDLR